jgi:hypothetical protein
MTWTGIAKFKIQTTGILNSSSFHRTSTSSKFKISLFFSAALRIAILVSVAASVSLWAWPLGPTSTWATLLWLPRQFGFEPSWTPALVSALAPALNFHRLRSLSSHLQSPTRSPLLDQVVPHRPRASGTRRQLRPSDQWRPSPPPAQTG